MVNILEKETFFITNLDLVSHSSELGCATYDTGNSFSKQEADQINVLLGSLLLKPSWPCSLKSFFSRKSLFLRAWVVHFIIPSPSNSVLTTRRLPRSESQEYASPDCPIGLDFVPGRHTSRMICKAIGNGRQYNIWNTSKESLPFEKQNFKTLHSKFTQLCPTDSFPLGRKD